MSDTTAPQQQEGFKKHPIQLVSLKVVELSIKVNLDNDQEEKPDPKKFTLSSGYSNYDEETKTIVVKVSAQISPQEEQTFPFELKVELMGLFEVDDSRFPLVHINDWARRNAPIILYPYLREHVYGLTSRCGFDGVLLPLLEVPTIRITETPNT